MDISVYAECRPNLRACNFFIKSDEISETSKILIEESRIDIKLSLAIFSFCLPDKAVSLMSNSLSGLTYAHGSVSFRCQIKDFLSLDEGRTLTDCPDFKGGEHVRFVCASCMEPLSEKRSFNRVLPLPSSEDFDNFFCHHHSTDNGSLDPGDSDFFYNPFFYKIHSSKLNDIIEMNLLKCSKCRATLGEVTAKCAKLWSSSVHILQSNKEKLKSPLQMHIESIKSFVNNLPAQMNKFVFTSLLDGGVTHYILLWVIDRRLTILSGRGHSLENKAHLDVGKVMKVMYSFYQELTCEVNDWLKSFSTSVVPIPPQIEHEFLKYLETMTENIPSDFKNVNDMNVSYI